MSDITVKGLSELQAFLDQLPAKLQNNVMRGAMAAAAKVVRDRARLMCPVGVPSGKNAKAYHDYEGALRDSIGISSTRIDRASGQVVAKLTAGGKNKKTGANVYYAYMIEFTGAQPHRIIAKKGSALLLGTLFAKSLEHPGFHPKPFMRPALDATASEAVVAAGNYVKSRLATKQGLDTSDITIEAEQ